MNWQSIVVSTTAASVSALEDLFWQAGAVSVSVEDGADDPLFEPGPGETPLWKTLLVTGLFEEDVDAGKVRELLGSNHFDVLAVDVVADRVWEREWLSRFEPMQFGKQLWVCPTGREVPDPAAVVLRLDPGLAFGTGTHATTRLCLEWLAAAPIKGKRVLDYGCGSGILAIAALLLGAAEVIAVDNDPQAITASGVNAERNGVGSRLAVCLPGDMPGGVFDVVVANILAQPLVDLAGKLQGVLAAGGELVLSGIMESQAGWVMAAYPEVDFGAPAGNDGWARVSGKRR